MQINRKLLLDTLGFVRSGLEPRGIIEQTDSFIFMGGRVVTYSDEISVSAPLPLDIRGAVSAKQIYALLGKTVGMDLDITTDGSELVVTSNTGMIARVGISHEILVPIDMLPTAEDNLWVPLDEGFNEKLRFCLQTVRTDYHKERLRSIHWRRNIIESSDNMRITQCTTNTFLPDGIEVLLEGTSVSELVKLDPAFFQRANGWMHFKTRDAVIFSCRSSEAPYPDIDTAVQSESSTPIKFSPRLPKILDRAMTFAERDSVNHYFVKVSIEDSRLIVRAGQDFRQFEESCGVHCQGDFEFAINPEFLKKMLKEEARVSIIETTAGAMLLKLDRDGFSRFMAL